MRNKAVCSRPHATHSHTTHAQLFGLLSGFSAGDDLSSAGGPRKRRLSIGVVAITNGSRTISNVSLISAAMSALIILAENIEVSMT